MIIKGELHVIRDLEHKNKSDAWYKLMIENA